MPVGVAWISPSARASRSPSASMIATAARPRRSARDSASARSRARSALGVEDRHAPRAEPSTAWPTAAPAPPAPSSTTWSVARAGQAALERLLEAARVGVVPDEAVAARRRRC